MWFLIVSRKELVEALSGRLAILEPARVRFRPPNELSGGNPL
jgi:hypothetical protein